MKKYLSILCLLLCFGLLTFLEADDPSHSKKTVCLNMIVKNESKVITRCLDSVLPLIDTWVIVDTGSTDGTQEVIRNYMLSKGIPGELYERPWKNFGFNRNEALILAKGVSDYVLFIDADEVLIYDHTFALPHLDKDFYYIMTHFGGMTYARVQLVNNEKFNWEWIGVLHETVNCPQARHVVALEGVWNEVHTDGARSTDPMKYHNDAKILEQGLVDEPNNVRYVFYLAQSYRDAGVFPKALENYKKRISLGGWDQEVFWSMLQVACLQEWMDMPYEIYSESYYEAYTYRPSRVEPLYHLMNKLRRDGNYQEGYDLGLIAKTVPLSKDILFLDKWMYDYGVLLEHSICAYWIGKVEECRDVSLQILNLPGLPTNVRECVENNLVFANAKIVENKKNKKNKKNSKKG